MFIVVQGDNSKNYKCLINQYYELRKKIFYDELAWKVNIQGAYERDMYDDLDPVYLLWCNENYTQLYGGMRLMPTTGPTLLYDTFRATFPDSASLIAPGIWEGTRMCININALQAETAGMKAADAFSLFLLALCEVAIYHGISSLICNYEPPMKRIYLRSGVVVNELGRANNYGKYPVCCGLFEVSKLTLASMRNKQNVNYALTRYG